MDREIYHYLKVVNFFLVENQILCIPVGESQVVLTEIGSDALMLAFNSEDPSTQILKNR